jgi:hypothetical protein
MIKIFFDFDFVMTTLLTFISLCFIGGGIYIWFLYFSVGRKAKVPGSDVPLLAFASLLIFVGIFILLLSYKIIVFIPIGG